MQRDRREYELPKRIDRLVGLLAKMLAEDGDRALQEVLVNSKLRVVEETGFDNWNGGQYGHDVVLTVPEDLLIPFIRQKTQVEDRLRIALNELVDVRDEYVEGVLLELDEDSDPDWRQSSGLLKTGGKPIHPATEGRIWQGGRYRLFLSHKTEVKRRAAALKQSLELYGVASFVAHEDIHPTQDWQNEIEAALSTADAFVAVLTENFHDSLWTDQEVGYALARGIPIIALRLGRDPYGFIGKFQALSCQWDAAPKEIVKLLIRQDRMVGAYAEAIRAVENFNAANTLAEILEYIDKLSEEGAKSIVDAYNENIEARGGFGFNGQNPRTYGRGLAFHLRRCGVRGFEFGEHRKLVRTRK